MTHRRRVAGYALVAILGVIVFAAAVALGTQLSSAQRRLKQADATVRALAQAKEALLAYAAAHPTIPGVLPCPDINNAATYEGSPKTTGSNCSAYIGRLPWKKLGLADLRDGAGECLWYALSPRFQDAGSHTLANGKAINATVPGALNVQDDFGKPVKGSPLVAIVFAPGPALPGQNRTGAANHPICGGNDQAGNYLDVSPSGINNATGNGAYRFATSALSNSFNDSVIGIDANELFAGVNKRIVGEVRASLKLYFDATSALPYAASSANSGLATAGLGDGFVPWYDLQPPPFINALTSNDKNGWFGLIGYRRQSASTATLTLSGQTYAVSFN